MPDPSPVAVLREYRPLAPWSLRDLATLAASILEASDVRPISAAARARPNERTIRYYVTKRLVEPPDGKGPAATYSYRHLLHVLAIKLRQMEGADLATIARELSETSGDALEHRVAGTLGPSLRPPDELALAWRTTPTRGRSGRMLRQSATGHANAEVHDVADPTMWRRVPVEPGIELHIAHDHPLSQLETTDSGLADAVGTLVARLLGTPRRRTVEDVETNPASRSPA